MARNWIKVETVTADKPEVCVLATQLKMDPDAVVGKLVRLWSWAEVNRIDGKAMDVTMEFLDKVVGKRGFGAALMKAGWLRETAEGKLEFPNFGRHNGPTGKGRALTAQRVSRHRERKRLSDEAETDGIRNSVGSDGETSVAKQSAHGGELIQPNQLKKRRKAGENTRVTEKLSDSDLESEEGASEAEGDVLPPLDELDTLEVDRQEHEFVNEEIEAGFSESDGNDAETNEFDREEPFGGFEDMVTEERSEVAAEEDWYERDDARKQEAGVDGVEASGFGSGVEPGEEGEVLSTEEANAVVTSAGMSGISEDQGDGGETKSGAEDSGEAEGTMEGAGEAATGGKGRRSRGGAGTARKVVVAEPPDQPLLF